MKKAEKLANQLNNLTSQDQWKFIIDNKDSISSIDLDNDVTYVNWKGDKESEYSTSTIDYIGNGPGVELLFHALGIEAQGV